MGTATAPGGAPFAAARRAAAAAVAALALLLAAGSGSARAQGQAQPAPAAPPPAPAREAFDSPAATLETFVTAKYEGDKKRAVECLDLSQVTRDSAEEHAEELYRCINRIMYLEFDRRAWDGLRAGRIGRRATWTFFPDADGLPLLPRQRRRLREVRELAPDARIVLTRQAGGEWRFSAETVKGSRAFWEAVKDLPMVSGLTRVDTLLAWERVERLWPASFVSNRFLHVKYWQWITLFLLIVLGLALDFSLRFLLATASLRAIRRRGGEAKRKTLRKTVRPFGLAAAAVFWLWAVRLLGLPDEALRVVVPAVRLFFMLAIVWSAYRLTDLLSEVAASQAARTDTKFDDVLVPLVRKAVKIFITVFGLIYIADNLDVPLAPLLTGLGIGGAGFAFAAKDTLEHFFGSVTVIVDRPFEVGDWVMIGEVEGIVEELGFRSTRVRTFYNSLVTIPNGNLVRAVVDNYGQRKYRRWSTHLNLTYDTPPAKLEAFCEGVREIVRHHPYTRTDYYQVWLHQFGPHSLDVLLYVFFETPDWQTELRERHRLMLDIIRLADRLGVAFAFPTQTLYLRREEGGAGEASEPPDAEFARRARATGRRAVRAIIAEADWRRQKPPPYVFEPPEDSEAEEGGETQVESKVGGDA